MGLSIYLIETKEVEVFETNITHNLRWMAHSAAIYEYLWRPDEIGIERAKELIEPLTSGLEKLKRDPKFYKQFDAENGWGVYEQFIPWLEEYIKQCKEYPESKIEIRR